MYSIADVFATIADKPEPKADRLALSASYSRAEARFLLHLRIIIEADLRKKFGSNLGPKLWFDRPKNGQSEQ